MKKDLSEFFFYCYWAPWWLEDHRFYYQSPFELCNNLRMPLSRTDISYVFIFARFNQLSLKKQFYLKYKRFLTTLKLFPAARFFQTITHDTFTKKLVILGFSQVFFADLNWWESNCELDFSLSNFLKVTSTSLPSGTRKIKLISIVHIISC